LTPSPSEEYITRRDARAKELARLARLDQRISQSRLAIVAATALCVVLVVRDIAPAWSLAIPIASFAALAVWHDRVLRAVDRMTRAIAFYDHGLARLEDRWQTIGESGTRFLDEHHLYSGDLDIFGPASLFQLLSRARTNLGEGLLAAWLTNPAPLHVIRLRQQAVAELRDPLDFREALATAGSESQVNTSALNSWAASPAAPRDVALRAAAIVLSTGIVGATIWWARGGPATPLYVFIVLKMVLTRPSRERVARVVEGVEHPLRQLDVLAEILGLIERATFTSTRLDEIRTAMMSHGVLPSRAIRRLKRFADMLDWRGNMFFAPISAALSWPLHLAAAIEGWRREFGPKVSVWLSAVAEYEALCSFGAYAYEHGEDPFPRFVEEGPSRFEGTGLGHPLVPAGRMVRNDVQLTPQVRLLIVSGSNMSGKSTLLRTVGVNVVLAMAGAPVRAQHLTLTPLAVGATLHVHDSLQAGRSRFFAEIERIRAIADLTERTPKPIVLLDELLQGTNSHDRAIGAEALLRMLIDRGAIGLITTHDLALAAIADRSGGRAANVHFEDELRGGELVFDYKMRLGPVTHSNALALMKAVGLPVGQG
jgi:hypothetical protein